MIEPQFTSDDWYWRLPDGRVYSSRLRSFLDRSPDDLRTVEAASFDVVEQVLGRLAPNRLPDESPVYQTWLREQIRLEADRRIKVAIGARTLEHSYEAQLTGTATAAAIINKRIAGLPLTPEEQWVEFTYSALFDFVRRVKTAQNVLEASPVVDFTDDRYWPAS